MTEILPVAEEDLPPCSICGGVGAVALYRSIAINGWVVQCSKHKGDRFHNIAFHGTGMFPTVTEAIAAWNERHRPAEPDAALGEGSATMPPAGARWNLGDLVQKKRGSQWRGPVVGFYSTNHTPIGYVVMSMYEDGSVQAWPEAALDDLES